MIFQRRLLEKSAKVLNKRLQYNKEEQKRLLIVSVCVGIILVFFLFFLSVKRSLDRIDTIIDDKAPGLSESWQKFNLELDKLSAQWDKIKKLNTGPNKEQVDIIKKRLEQHQVTTIQATTSEEKNKSNYSLPNNQLKP